VPDRESAVLVSSGFRPLSVDRAGAHVDQTANACGLGRGIHGRERAQDDIRRTDDRVHDVIASGNRIANGVDIPGVGDAPVRFAGQRPWISYDRASVDAFRAQTAEYVATDESTRTDDSDPHPEHDLTRAGIIGSAWLIQ
jgi:hypothetical protein